MKNFGIFKLFRSNAQRGADYDALVETECTECFIRVAGFKEKDPRDNVVFITAFSSHNSAAIATWSWRRTRIWRILRGRNDPDYEILTVEVMDNVIKAMQECREALWGGGINSNET